MAHIDSLNEKIQKSLESMHSSNAEIEMMAEKAYHRLLIKYKKLKMRTLLTNSKQNLKFTIIIIIIIQ